MNNEKIEKTNKVKELLLIVVLIVVSIFLCIVTIKRIKYFSYEEIEAVLISHGKISDSGDSSPSCVGTFEYDVNGRKYQTTFSISHYDCRDGYKRTIYYDANNPQNSSSDRSITMLLIVISIDAFVIGGLIVMIKGLFKPTKNKEKNINDFDNRIQKHKILNHSVYGNYEITYDSEDDLNKYDSTGIKHLELTFNDGDVLSNSQLHIYFPESLINDLFDSNKMDKVLNSYHRIDSKYIEDIVKIFINQEIEKLSNWYSVPNSQEGKKILNDKKNIFIEGFEIDNDSNIVLISFSYNYSDDDVATFLFNYDVKEKIIKDVDISS